MRSVTKLLKETYASLCQSEGPIGTRLYDKWHKGPYGEAVGAEAFATLDAASRAVTEDRFMRFWAYEQDEDNSLKALFEEAMRQTENPPATVAP